MRELIARLKRLMLVAEEPGRERDVLRQVKLAANIAEMIFYHDLTGGLDKYGRRFIPLLTAVVIEVGNGDGSATKSAAAKALRFARRLREHDRRNRIPLSKEEVAELNKIIYQHRREKEFDVD